MQTVAEMLLTELILVLGILFSGLILFRTFRSKR